jgi:hypothetical protein
MRARGSDRRDRIVTRQFNAKIAAVEPRSRAAAAVAQDQCVGAALARNTYRGATHQLSRAMLDRLTEAGR